MQRLQRAHRAGPRADRCLLTVDARAVLHVEARAWRRRARVLAARGLRTTVRLAVASGYEGHRRRRRRRCRTASDAGCQGESRKWRRIWLKVAPENVPQMIALVRRPHLACCDGRLAVKRSPRGPPFTMLPVVPSVRLTTIDDLLPKEARIGWQRCPERGPLTMLRVGIYGLIFATP